MQTSFFSIILTVGIVFSNRFRFVSSATVGESQIPPEIVALKRVTSPRSTGASRLVVNGYDDGIHTESAVAFLTASADLVFDGRPMTIEFNSGYSDDDDVIQTTVVFDVWQVYKSPPSIWWLHQRRQISVTFVCRTKNRRLRSFVSTSVIFGLSRMRRLSDDILSSPLTRYRDWCEADIDLAHADASYVVFAIQKDAVFWALGSPEPATDNARHLAHIYSQPHRGW